MNIGPPTPAPSPHIQIIPNGSSNGSNVNQLLNSMPPPILPVGMPLQQVVHNLQHLTNVNGLNQQHQQQVQQQVQQVQQQQVQHQAHQTLLGSQNTNGLNGIHQNQSLPPTSQLLQAIHHNTSNNNNNNNAINNNNNSITQYQVQQLWRHHAYLNGNVF